MMQGIRRPSRQAMDEAAAIGARMAMKEMTLRPSVDGAGRYPSYAHFAEAHRTRLEMLSACSLWGQQVTRLAEMEAEKQGLDFTTDAGRDAFVRHFATPMRCSFWFGWETAVGLQAMYDQRVGGRLRSGRPVLRVAGGVRHGEEERPWKSTASGLMELAGSDALDDLSVRPEDLGGMLPPRPGA